MNKNDIHIRLETPKDHAQVESLVREAFWNVYRPGCLEHYVLHRMRATPAFVPELAFIMERNAHRADRFRPCGAAIGQRRARSALRATSTFTGTSACYFVDEAEAEAFDRRFPPKERLKTATQIF